MLYTFKANVFNERLGSQFGRIVNTTILANNEEDAFNEAKKSFDKYVNRLKINHNNDFSYDNLKIV